MTSQPADGELQQRLRTLLEVAISRDEGLEVVECDCLGSIRDEQARGGKSCRIDAVGADERIDIVVHHRVNLLGFDAAAWAGIAGQPVHHDR